MAPLYSLNPLRAARQVLADASFIVWCVLWWVIAGRAGDQLRAAAEPARAAGDRVHDVSAQVSQAADQAGGLPMIGDALAKPLTGLAGALGQLSAVGAEQAAVIENLAHWTELALVCVPVAFAVLAWLPARLRFVRRSLQLRSFRSAVGGPELLALRAMSNQPLRRLRRVHADPVAAWKAGDPKVVAALADLELAEHGLSGLRVTGGGR